MLPLAPDAIHELAVGLGRRAVGARGLRSGHAAGVDLEAAVGAREGCPHTGAAVVGGRRALRLPVYIARGFVVIRRPSRGAAFGVGRARGCLCLMALRCERRPAGGGAARAMGLRMCR